MKTRSRKREVNMSELKPCPFCNLSLLPFGHEVRDGKVVETYKHPEDTPLGERYCPLSMLVFSVIEWNTRPIEDELQEKLDYAVSFIGEGCGLGD